MTLHADDNAVSLLSMAMTTKLRKMRAKGRAGWDSESCTQQHLSNLLRAAVEKGDTVDVANYCAFLLARDESILPGEQPKPVASGGWMEQLGFEVRQHDEMLRIVVDDCGNEREATLTERVLWDALMAANAEFASAPQAPAAPSDGLEVLLNEALAEVKRIVDAEQVSLAPTFHNEVRRPNDKRKFHMGDARRAARNAAAALEKAFDVVIAGTVAAPAAPAVDALAPVQALLDVHAELLDANPYAYFELAYTRQTGWMAWITDKPMYGAQLINPDRKVLARGQGDTPAEACAAAAQAAAKGEHDE